MEKAIITVGVAIAVLLAVFLGISAFVILNGLAVQLYWMWFIIPIFPTLVPLTLAKAVGLSSFVSLFTFTISRYDHEQEKLEGKEKLFYALKKVSALYAVIFVTGWIIHLFVN